ncbi:MAG: sensor histidine kinase [Pyrinomonadaceae bacterium]
MNSSSISGLGKQVTDSPEGKKRAPVEPVADERIADLIEQLQTRTVELEEANRELRHISHYRSLFLARMSHELRTPLTSILGFAEIMLDQEKLSEPQRRFCQKIQNSGMQLLASLNQLVDLSRLEAGPAEIFLQELSFPETLRETCAAVGRQAQKREVKIEFNLEPEVTTIVSDRGRLRQVLYTFLAWAVSRSQEGQRVTIDAKLLDGSSLQVRIDDEGERINDISRVFDPVDTPRAGKTDLNELGIIVGRRLLELMKGTVTLENRDGTGLRTVIEVPATSPKTEVFSR